MKRYLRHGWRVGGGLLAVGALVVTAGCAGAEAGSGGAGSGSFADMDPITLSYAEPAPQAGTSGIASDAFMAYVEEHTNGKITFEPYYASSLVPQVEALAAAGSGVADIASISAPSYNPSELPVANWVNFFGSLPKEAGPMGFMQEVLSIHEAYTTSEAIQEEFASQNVKPLAAIATGMWANMCSEEVGNPEQAEGKTVSSPGGAWNGEAEAVGFVTQYLPGQEIYEGLQRGVITCFLNPVTSLTDLGVAEVAPYASIANWSSAVGSLIPAINLDTWNSLPEEAQQVLIDGGVAYVEAYIDACLEAFANAVGTAEEQGVTFLDPAPLNAVLDPHRAAVVEELPDTMPAGANVELLESYEASLEKWGTALTDLGVENPDDPMQAALNGPDQPWQGVIEQLSEELAANAG